ncbi:MAG: L-fuculose-phosphate aldolase [Enterobacteriaceae bacterium]
MLVVLVVLANDHLIMITAHFPLFFLKIRHFFYRYQLVDPKDPTYKGMLITPTGIPYDQLSESDIVYIDQEGHHDAGKLPSSEWFFHMAAYQTRPDAHAVIHNHAVHCAAVSILNRPIPAIHYMIAVAGGNSIPCAPYATFGTRELSQHVAVALRDRKAILLQHHGMIACEVNLQKALWLANEVEVLARLYLSTLAITDPVPTLEDAEIDIVLEKFKTYGLRIEE